MVESGTTLMEKGYMKHKNARLLAMEFYMQIKWYLWIVVIVGIIIRFFLEKIITVNIF